jgi:hypothetical protein
MLPFVVAAVLGYSIVDQEEYTDPEYYTGYGQSFWRMWQVFGLNYYSARFPIMFLNTTTQWLSPGLGGYVLARLLVFAICAAPFYLLARRRYGRNVALASYAFLILNPLLPRILSWDLTTFLSIPAGFAGITCWYLSTRRWSLATFAAGFLFGVSVNCHVFTGTAIAVFFLVELVFASRRPDGLGWFLARAATCAAGGLACLALGLLFYATTVGPVSAWSLWAVTAGAIQAGQQYHTTHFLPLASYYAVNYEMYAPLFSTALAIAVNRGALLADTLEARITTFAVAYLAAYAVAVFVLGMNVLQYFWYFAHLTIAVYLVVPVILARLVERIGTSATAWFTAPLALVAFLVTLRFADVFRLALAARQQAAVVAALALLAAASLTAVSARSRRSVIFGTVAAGALIQVPFMSLSHLSPYDVRANRAEQPLFEIVMAYQSLLNEYDAPDRRVRTWYPTQKASLMSVAASNLMFTLQERYVGQGMPLFGNLERERIADPSTRYVLLMDTTTAGVDAGLAALGNAGVATIARERRVWGRSPLVVHAVLVELKK